MAPSPREVYWPTNGRNWSDIMDEIELEEQEIRDAQAAVLIAARERLSLRTQRCTKTRNTRKEVRIHNLDNWG